MRVTWDDYGSMHERLGRLRELGVGLDGVIAAKGGEVRVHLPLMAVCNQTLYNRVTALLQRGGSELRLKDVPLAGVQALVDFCYSGTLDVDAENFPDIVEAALAMEFLGVVEKCVRFAVDEGVNANAWTRFLRTAFRYPRCVQPEEFVPNLILDNITHIPREALVGSLEPGYLRGILENGNIIEENRNYVINVFLEILATNKGEMKSFNEAFSLLKKHSGLDEDIKLPKNCGLEKVMAVLSLSLTLDFSALVRACTLQLEEETIEILPFTQILQLISKWEANDSCMYLKAFIREKLVNLPPSVCEDDLCWILERDWLDPLSEYAIFKTSLNWLIHNNSSLETKNRVMSLIRFGLLSKNEMENVFKDHAHDMRGCAEILLPAMSYHLSEYTKPMAMGALNKMRFENHLVHVFGGKDLSGNVCSSFTLIRADSKRKTLEVVGETFTPPIALGDRCAAAEMNGFIFISGGASDELDIDCTFRLDTRNNDWLQLASMTSPRHCHTLTAVIKSKTLLSVGGRRNKDILDCVDVYNVALNTWSAIAKIPYPNCQHASCYDSLGEQVFTSGGEKNGKSMLCYTDDAWSQKSPMLHSRAAHNMIATGGQIIVMGGSKGHVHLMSTDCYDVVQDQWTELSTISSPTSYSCSVAVNNYILMMGGKNQETLVRLDLIQRYDVEKDEWEVCEERLPGARSGACAVSIP